MSLIIIILNGFAYSNELVSITKNELNNIWINISLNCDKNTLFFLITLESLAILKKDILSLMFGMLKIPLNIVNFTIRKNSSYY